ncbi:hypothetical protein OFB74_30910, partial [Escherichia coli]|nr:hypothetical protein [Escherichia coli]
MNLVAKLSLVDVVGDVGELAVQLALKLVVALARRLDQGSLDGTNQHVLLVLLNDFESLRINNTGSAQDEWQISREAVSSLE